MCIFQIKKIDKMKSETILIQADGIEKNGKVLPRKPNVVQMLSSTPTKHLGTLVPTNLEEQKERFLKYGIIPK